jgi:Zn-finger nucleic acid-binding protein
VIEGLPRERALARACPSCGEGMVQENYDRKAEGRIDLDFCYGCQAIWFDPYESTQLTPGAVMKLFEAIHRTRDAQQRPLSDVCKCPVCRAALVLTHDLQRTNRITYYRCPNAHGRLTTFYQFLREKNFIRSLTAGEITQLRATVKQVRCTSCGAPVNLERDAQCTFCRAPIAILDADAVQRALADLSAEEQKRRQVDPQAAIDALLAGQRSGRARSSRYPVFERDMPSWNEPSLDTGVVDLVGEVIDFVMHFD